ncbi:hypothetical protein BCR35DRAFT_25177 [Leucosporidium creatinivorum]|uniref:Uncharacterized protein n=1 Tax=Leucosporidium creatinivorum TaxID=106004 RepID=A0A1Y2CTC2_9BASI|nr:hypothetical protein BCR35DRAFT_25177 [Leucosporidium creatinivorum]
MLLSPLAQATGPCFAALMEEQATSLEGSRSQGNGARIVFSSGRASAGSGGKVRRRPPSPKSQTRTPSCHCTRTTTLPSSSLHHARASTPSTLNLQRSTMWTTTLTTIRKTTLRREGRHRPPNASTTASSLSLPSPRT